MSCTGKWIDVGLLSVLHYLSMQLANRKSQAKFVTFTVNSKADLDSMRRNLGSIVDYIEADLTAFMSIRALSEAAGDGANRNIPTAEVTVIKDTVPTLPALKELPGASMGGCNVTGLATLATSESCCAYWNGSLSEPRLLPSDAKWERWPMFNLQLSLERRLN